MATPTSIKAQIAAAVVIALLAGGCDVFKPKTDFYGYAHNATQWRLICPMPSDPTKRYALQPTNNFYDVLEGSRVYHFEADFPDGSVYSAFDFRINSIDDDAGADGIKVGWYWEIGHSIQASRKLSVALLNVTGPRPRLVVLD